MFRYLLAAIAALYVTGQAQASSIDFGNSDVDPFVSLSQNGFTIARTVGTAWDLTTSFAASGAALATAFNGETSQLGDRVEITRNGGGLFSFISLAQRARSSSNNDGLDVIGLLGGVQVFQSTLSNSILNFETINSPSGALIDTLRFEVSFKGGNSRFVDDIELRPATVVPLPSSLVMLASVLSLAGFRLRRRRS